MRYLLIIVLLFFIRHTYAQSTIFKKWEPKVFDQSTKQSLEIASISINKKIDFPLNEYGIAKIPIELLKKGDSIYISCLGYKTEYLVVNEINHLSINIGLQQATYSLNQVNIINYKNKIRELIVGTRAFSISQYHTNIETKHALFIKNINQNKGYIKEIIIRMKNGAGGRRAPFKLQLYQKNKESIFPGKEIMNGIIVQNINNNEWFNIDLAYLGLKIPIEGFFISVEMLTEEYYSGKMKKIHGRFVKQLPELAFTTFPKSYNTNNYSIVKYKNTGWFLEKDIEYQMQAKLLLTDE